MRAAILLFLLASAAHGETVITGDAWVIGKAGVGTATPSARLEVKAGSATETAFLLSGVDATPFLMVDKTGRVGLSTNPAANLDVYGIADASDAALQLRNGNLYPASGSRQITFGYDNTTDYRHAVESAHVNSVSSNSINFLIWDSSLAAGTIATRNVVSLVTHSTGAAVHIQPVSYADADMVASNGSVNGGGTVHRALEVTSSSLELKTDIEYLDQDEELRAYQELESLKHAEFRYKRRKGKVLARDKKAPLKRGLIYEDAPGDIKRSGGFLSVDGRILNAELALKELIRRLEDAKSKAESLGAGQ